MPAHDWTPAETARQDQLLAQADLILDTWIRRAREQIAEHGENQGLANVTLALAMTDGYIGQDSLLIAALRRLAREPLAQEDPQQRQAREIHGIEGRTLEDPREPGSGPPP